MTSIEEASKYQMLLHFGFHKTGSTAIQNMLYSNAKKLPQLGLSYKDPQQRTSDVQSGNIDEIFRQLLVDPDPKTVKNSLSQHLENDSVSIVSNEGLSILPLESIDILFTCLRELEVDFRVLAYFRNPIDYFLSAYNQTIKRHGYFGTLSDYVDDHHWGHFISLSKLQKLCLKHELHVVHYDRVQNNLFNSFWDCIETLFGVNAKESIQDNEKISNRSLRQDELNIMRVVNAISGDSYSTMISDFFLNSVEPSGPILKVNSEIAEKILEKTRSELNWINETFFPNDFISQDHLAKYDANQPQQHEVFPRQEIMIQIIEIILNHKDRVLNPQETGSIDDLHLAAESVGYFSNLDDENLFDNIFYLLNHRDVLKSGLHPFEHFKEYGMSEGRKFRTISKFQSNI